MSDDKIVPIGPSVRLHGDKEPDVVLILQNLLERAIRGEIFGIAFATVEGNTTILQTGWAGGAGTKWPLFAATRLLEQRYLRALDGDIHG